MASKNMNFDQRRVNGEYFRIKYPWCSKDSRSSVSPKSIVFQISIMMSKAQIDLRHSSPFRVKFLPNYKETQNQNFWVALFSDLVLFQRCIVTMAWLTVITPPLCADVPTFILCENLKTFAAISVSFWQNVEFLWLSVNLLPTNGISLAQGT